MPSRLIQVVTNYSISFILMMNKIPLYIYIFFIQTFIDGHLGCFHILA